MDTISTEEGDLKIGRDGMFSLKKKKKGNRSVNASFVSLWDLHVHSRHLNVVLSSVFIQLFRRKMFERYSTYSEMRLCLSEIEAGHYLGGFRFQCATKIARTFVRENENAQRLADTTWFFASIAPKIAHTEIVTVSVSILRSACNCPAHVRCLT